MNHVKRYLAEMKNSHNNTTEFLAMVKAEDHAEVVAGLNAELDRLCELEKRLHLVLEYCKPHIDHMWAAWVVSLITGCDFRDSKAALVVFSDKNEQF